MANIGSLSVSIAARTEKFERGIGRSVTALGRFTKAAGIAVKAAAAFSGAIVGAGVASLSYLVKSQFSAVDALAKTADKLGITTEKLSGLQLAAEETGVSSNTLNTALQRMVRRVSEASHGFGEARGALGELGLDAVKLARLSPDEQFREIAGAMANVGSQGDKVRLAMKLFDSEGVALVNTLKLGRTGLDEVQGAAERAGLTVSREMAGAIERANDAFGRLKMAFIGLGRQIAVRIAPLFEKASTWLNELLTSDGRIRTFANAIAAGIGGAIAAIIDAVHQLRIGLAEIRLVFNQLLLDLKTSGAGKALGINMDSLDAMKLGENVQAAWWDKQELLKGANPADTFRTWFNKHLDNAFNETPTQKANTSPAFDYLKDSLLSGIGGSKRFAMGFANGASNVGPINEAILAQTLSDLSLGFLGKNFRGRAVADGEKAVRTNAALVAGTQAARTASRANMREKDQPIREVADHTRKTADNTAKLVEHADAGPVLKTKNW